MKGFISSVKEKASSTKIYDLVCELQNKETFPLLSKMTKSMIADGVLSLLPWFVVLDHKEAIFKHHASGEVREKTEECCFKKSKHCRNAFY